MTAFTQALIGGAVFSIVVAVAGGLLTRLSPWYFALRKPRWKPPDWSFGPIWTMVFLLLTIAIAYAWDAADAGQRTALLVALAVNGALNIAWSAIFFTMKNPTLALYELIVFWFSIVALIIVMGLVSRTAGVLLAPYLAWVTAAGLLNYQIVQLNKAHAAKPV